VAEQAGDLHILAVDDKPLIRWGMVETLVVAGNTVIEAGTGQEALERLSLEPKPDVVLLDYRLPDSNDLRLLKSIRQVVPNSAVIMMTAFGTGAMQRAARELGVFRVVDKPIDLRALESLVQQAYCARVSSAEAQMSSAQSNSKQGV